MSSRSLIHVLVVVIVAIAIYFFPESRGSQARAGFESDSARETPAATNDAQADAGDKLLGIGAIHGLHGRTIAGNGTALAGIRLEAASASLPGDSAQMVFENMSTQTLADGSFELPFVDPECAILLRDVDFQALAERRVVQTDGTILTLLVLAPTSPVAGRLLGGSGGELVRFHATHARPKAARVTDTDIEIEFERSVRVRGDGSFDFGRVPCSDGAYVEASDDQGHLKRVTLLAAGTLEATLDLR